MKNKGISRSLLFAGLFLFGSLTAQEYVTRKENKIILDNGLISRTLELKNDSFRTISLQYIDGAREEFVFGSNDFSFKANDKDYAGTTGWVLEDIRNYTDESGGEGVKITLTEKTSPSDLQLELFYLLYPDLPLIRKWMQFTNKGSDEIMLESLNIEDLNTSLNHVHSVVYHKYARMKHLGRFTGDWDDPLVVVHHVRGRRGIAIGNEVPAVLKRTAFHSQGSQNNIETGFTHIEQDFPFSIWLDPGEVWETPKTFLCLYTKSDNAFQVVENEVNSFMIKYMKPRILQLDQKPVFVYNTWNPFRTFVSDSLVREVAEAAADCGIEEFIIDDGWQINHKGQTSKEAWGGNYGDWLVDDFKFKGGLKPSFDYINSLGMKPGLWVSLASATRDSKVFTEHPEWFVEGPDGNPGNVHLYPYSGGLYSASFGTDWYNYIKETLLRLVNEYGLAYAKLDLAVVTSPYVNNDSISGSYATDHPYHKDHRESFYVIYDRLLKLFDALHEEAPGLFIDCTFETAGKLQLMDYAIAMHADGNWLSNYEEPSPLGPLRIRQMAWWRTPVLPASSLVIGNLAMDDPDFEFGLKSLIGTLPIVLGDPREIPEKKREGIKNWSDWMRSMQEKHDYMTYRKDLPGFGEPQEGHWDGWQRINFQTQSGGIFGVFRQGALESSRRVFLSDLDPDANYVIKEAPTGIIFHEAMGKSLIEKGFAVELSKNYDGKIFEVCLVE